MEPGLYKYVRFSTDEIRFIDGMRNHKDLLNEGDTPISAGFLYLFDDYFRIDNHSSSLKLYPMEDDKTLIQPIVNRAFKDNY